MFRHIVMWKFREGTEEKANEFLTKLAALDGVIPQLKKSVRKTLISIPSAHLFLS